MALDSMDPLAGVTHSAAQTSMALSDLATLDVGEHPLSTFLCHLSSTGECEWCCAASPDFGTGECHCQGSL